MKKTVKENLPSSSPARCPNHLKDGLIITILPYLTTNKRRCFVN